MEQSKVVYVVSAALPLVFVFATGFVKSMVRKDFVFGSFYLGLDGAIAAMAAGFINIADLAQKVMVEGRSAENSFNVLLYNVAVVAVAAGALGLNMLIHQRWEDIGERTDKQRWARGVWLGVVANCIGSGSLYLFTVLKLKGTL